MVEDVKWKSLQNKIIDNKKQCLLPMISELLVEL